MLSIMDRPDAALKIWQQELQILLKFAKIAKSVNAVEDAKAVSAMMAHIEMKIGTQHKVMCDYPTASRVFQTALERLHSDDEILIYQLYHQLGKLFIESKEYPSAMEYLEKSAKIAHKVFGSGHPDSTPPLESMAELHHLQGNNDMALEIALQVEAVKRRTLGVLSPQTAAICSFIAQLIRLGAVPL